MRKTPRALQLLESTGTLEDHISASVLFLINKSGLMLRNHRMIDGWDWIRWKEGWVDGSIHGYPAFQLPPWAWILGLAWIRCPSWWAGALPTESPAPCPEPGRCCHRESCCCPSRSGSSLQRRRDEGQRAVIEGWCSINRLNNFGGLDCWAGKAKLLRKFSRGIFHNGPTFYSPSDKWLDQENNHHIHR